MSSHPPDQDALVAEANRLYWESDQSVNQIGESLGLSKGVLYGLVSPLPAGLPCPQCGEEMVFPNRTARERGFLACPDCGLEEVEEAVQAYWERAAEAELQEEPPVPGTLAQRAGRAVQEVVEAGKEQVSGWSPRSRVLAGTALLGVAAGLLIGGMLRKR